MSEINNYIVVDDNGLPIAGIDVDQIQAAATILGFDLAVSAPHEQEIEALLAEAVRKHGEGVKYVFIAALKHVVFNVLAPVLEVTSAHGTNLLPGLMEAAENARKELGGQS